ncbi:hypothetical protein A3C20_04940 [Candidatus Kaiserbacteria bacterium RIFCSPHIGHO2_02_FULL_55_25]|uniref:Uncharacterized protein n=1 Tax=Candidatus Kaiserbacteria bacterium RIFCSPHIGHO2_02_FULL_55_25 TaxID=1798498 RepID=A0A1F6E5U1_9BACT|nr:MAG: hypothetical protein A3C20_04940 [Candidatus Kaiserbacteria bacterium RIFCSPHIGHO2_02_FULL_55_25]OGG76993.1 MAG: hypothetical protein A3F56_01800 [Candidatus Kaiserbacteria bacterium RIFCSPHIGHO2_12_FULL_55_13]
MKFPERHKRTQRTVERLLKDANELAARIPKPELAGIGNEKVHIELKDDAITKDPAEVEKMLPKEGGMHIEKADGRSADMYSGDEPGAEWLRKHDPAYKPDNK